ncbi:hypothetical protein, partial [Jatrophihabitans endophyticus]|uniref:hypothetical protein n=1 Tax=Jatrophihabitans endophyticus TaxID=1206085 RepID=UPI001A0FBC5A
MHPTIATASLAATSPERFRGPEPSRADHVPSLRSRGSHRGSLVGGRVPTRIVYESSLESRTLKALLTDPDILDVREQVRMHYVDREGKRRTHVFDCHVSFSDNWRVLVAIKPHDLAVATRLHALMRWIAAQIPQHVADAVAVVTERHLSKAAARDAELIHDARRDGSGPADGAVMAAMVPTFGAVRVLDLMEASGC